MPPIMPRGALASGVASGHDARPGRLPMTEPVDHAATAVRELHGTFGRYEIERLLGRGGMGAVYLARQPALDRKVVIKVITSVYDGAVERFRREARAAARIDSDNVVKVYEADEVDGTPFIAMEFVDGRSLADLLALQGRMEPAVAASIVVGALRGL